MNTDNVFNELLDAQLTMNYISYQEYYGKVRILHVYKDVACVLIRMTSEDTRSKTTAIIERRTK